MGYSHYYTIQVPRLADEATAYAVAASEALQVANAWKAEHVNPGTGSRIGVHTKDGFAAIYGKLESMRWPLSLLGMMWGDIMGESVKTGRYGYDIAVAAVLCVLAESDCVRVTSDGDAEDWAPAAAFASRILLRPVAVPSTIKGAEAPAVAEPAPVAIPDDQTALVEYWRARALAAERLAGL